MNILLTILVVCMIGKDINYLNDPLTPRGIAQGLCALVGLVWLVANFSASTIQKYWPIWLYIGALFLTLLTASDKLAVAFQIGSLAAMVIFFIAYFESRRYKLGVNQISVFNNKPLINLTILCYTVIAIGSVALYKLDPSRANEVLGFGEIRFRGILGKSAALGSSLGLMVGVAWFGWKRGWVKFLPIAFGLIGMGLTLARTFWLALFVGVLITLWLYQPTKRKWVFAIVALVMSALIAVKGFDIAVSTKGVNAAARTDSLEHLSGRTIMWDIGFKELKKSPFLGYGFTAGASVVFKEWNRIRNFQGRESDKSRDTLHSGYVQSLLDSGYLGAFFYLLAIILAFRSLNKWDVDRQYPVEFFSMIFLIASNFTESIIFSAGTFTSLMFWATAVFAFSLKPAYSRQELAMRPAHA
jgi:O-antigen ligase